MVTVSLELEDSVWNNFDERYARNGLSELELFIHQRAADQKEHFLDILCKSDLMKRWNLNHPEKLNPFYDKYREMYFNGNEEWIELPRLYFPDVYREYRKRYNCYRLRLFGRIK